MLKYLERQLKEDGSERVVVLKEKHETRYFVIRSVEDMKKLCLKVVTQRHKEGYWYYAPEEPPKKPDYTAEEAATLKGSAQEAALDEIKNYKRELASYEEDKHLYALVLKAAEGDKEAALQVMFARREAEYEEFAIEKAESLE